MTLTDKPRRMVGYIRVSTEEQATGGVSLDFQRRAIENHALLRGHELVAVHADEGITGRHTERPALKAAVADACDKAAVFCVYSLSRATRSTRDAIDLADTLNRYGAELASLSENIDTTTAAGRLVFRTFASFAEFERELTGERCRAGIAECRRQGRLLCRPDRIPLGLRVTPGDPSRLEPDEGERRTLRHIAKRRRQGEKWRRIAEELNFRGWKRRGGKPWSGHDVMRAGKKGAGQDKLEWKA